MEQWVGSRGSRLSMITLRQDVVLQLCVFRAMPLLLSGQLVSSHAQNLPATLKIFKIAMATETHIKEHMVSSEHDSKSSVPTRRVLAEYLCVCFNIHRGFL